MRLLKKDGEIIIDSISENLTEILQNCNDNHISLERVSLINTEVRDVIFTNKSLESSEYHFCTFIDTTFHHCNITDIMFNSCKFIGCTFTKCMFTESTFINVEFYHCSLRNCDMSGVYGPAPKLLNVTFNNCIINHVKFYFTDLRLINIVNTDIIDTNMTFEQHVSFDLQNIDFKNKINVSNPLTGKPL